MQNRYVKTKMRDIHKAGELLLWSRTLENHGLGFGDWKMAALCGFRWENEREHYTFFGYSHSTTEVSRCILPKGHQGHHISYEDVTKKREVEVEVDEVQSEVG